MSTETPPTAPAPAPATATTSVTSPIPIPGAGSLTVVGLGAYTMLGAFYDPQDPTSVVGFSATGFGDIADVSESELLGTFFENPKDFVGTCQYQLAGIDVEEGIMVFSLWSADGKILIAELTGDSEGFGEAFTGKKNGSLYIKPKDHQNIVTFTGDSSVQSMTFHPTGELINPNGTYYGIETSHQGGRANQLSIDFQAKSDTSKMCADWFSDSVGGSEAHMIHTERGDNKPKVLYFAFKGQLIIDKTHVFDITLGQGEYVFVRRNWHLASMQLAADKNGKNGDLGPYRIEQDGINTFKVKKK